MLLLKIMFSTSKIGGMHTKVLYSPNLVLHTSTPSRSAGIGKCIAPPESLSSHTNPEIASKSTISGSFSTTSKPAHPLQSELEPGEEFENSFGTKSILLDTRLPMCMTGANSMQDRSEDIDYFYELQKNEWAEESWRENQVGFKLVEDEKGEEPYEFNSEDKIDFESDSRFSKGRTQSLTSIYYLNEEEELSSINTFTDKGFLESLSLEYNLEFLPDIYVPTQVSSSSGSSDRSEENESNTNFDIENISEILQDGNNIRIEMNTELETCSTVNLHMQFFNGDSRNFQTKEGVSPGLLPADLEGENSSPPPLPLSAPPAHPNSQLFLGSVHEGEESEQVLQIFPPNPTLLNFNPCPVFSSIHAYSNPSQSSLQHPSSSTPYLETHFDFIPQPGETKQFHEFNNEPNPSVYNEDCREMNDPEMVEVDLQYTWRGNKIYCVNFV